jgi:hypothetical protein
VGRHAVDSAGASGEHVDRPGVVPRDQLPQRGGREVTQNGALTAGLHRREEPPAHGQPVVADGVDAPMDPVQPPAPGAPDDAVVVQAAGPQLCE